jgi:hypothetical protein
MSHRREIRTLSIAALVAVGGCREPPPPPLALTATEIESPAGGDSGEPFLSVADGDVLMSWIGRSPMGVRDVRFARYRDSGWTEPRVVVEGERLLVNVSDFPSIAQGPDGVLWAHWLQRDDAGLGYGVRVVRSDDEGASWSEPWIPHADGTATEHGFVAILPERGGMSIVWLDGRAFAGREGAPPSAETALYSRSIDESGGPGPEVAVDGLVCDCCQTDVAVTTDGPILAYRDRSPEEIRDIRVARLEGGRWTPGPLVHEDGWETGACPINGPAVAASGDLVAVAWFTAAGGESRVNVAFSDDGGRTFDDAVRVDDGAPAGRVDILMLDDGSAVVGWLERTGGDRVDARVRRVGRGGHLLEAISATAPWSERVLGFPRLARAQDGVIIVAWTDGTEIVPKVRVTRIAVEEP